MVSRSVAALVLFCFAAPASATTINFGHLDTQDWTSASHLPGLTIEAGREVGGQVETGTAQIGHRRYGSLGVKSADDTGLADGTDQLDSIGDNDVAIFRFDRAVRLERITFTGTEYWDRFDLYLGADLDFERQMKVDDLKGYDWVSTILLGTGYISDTFAIGASEYQSCGYDIAHGHQCWTENSAFRISSITFSEVVTEAASATSVVPVPASMLLLLGGLGGLAALKRRRSA